MLAVLSPALVAAALGSSPTPCPSDLLVANPRLRVVRSVDRAVDNYIVTVDVTNRGVAAQPADTRQHLALARDGAVAGTQPVPALGPNQTYRAAFRLRRPHARIRPPFLVELRYVLDSDNAPAANCTSANDRLTARL